MNIDVDKILETGAKVVDSAKKTAVELAQKGKKQVDLLDAQAKKSKAERQLGALVYSLAKNGEENELLVKKYIDAIGICESAGMEVIIIDSISHCWDYLLDFHANLQGNSFANWAKVTPRQNAFIQRILNSSCHVICTMRSKQEYVLNERNGKMIPEKVGLKAVQRDNVDYEFTIVFDVNMKHYALASKDRTELFAGKAEFPLTEQVGMQILDWCNQCRTQPSVNYGTSYPAARTAQ